MLIRRSDRCFIFYQDHWGAEAALNTSLQRAHTEWNINNLPCHKCHTPLTMKQETDKNGLILIPRLQAGLLLSHIHITLQVLPTKTSGQFTNKGPRLYRFEFSRVYCMLGWGDALWGRVGGSRDDGVEGGIETLGGGTISLGHRSPMVPVWEWKKKKEQWKRGFWGGRDVTTEPAKEWTGKVCLSSLETEIGWVRGVALVLGSSL